MKPESSTNISTNSNQRWMSSLFSALFMGLGQLKNKQYLKGILFIIYQSIIWFINIDITSLVLGNIKLPGISLSFEPFYLLNYLQQKIYGVYTLGTIPGEDHSLFFLIEGLVAIIFTFILIGIHIFNIVDAYKNGKLVDQGEETPDFSKSWDNFLEAGFPYIGMSPGMVVLLVATVFPVIFTICLAFVNYDANHLPPGQILSWIGLRNFKDLVMFTQWKGAFVSVFTWTVIWAIASTILSYGLGLFVAVVLNHEHIKFRNVFRTILLVPWAIPAFVSILIWRYLLNYNFGHINKMLMLIGFDKIQWLSDPLYAKLAILMVNLWLSFPFAMAVCSGILQSISETLYEAAIVDGATILQKFFHITLPLVVRQVTPLLIMQFAFQFNNFGIIFLLNDGGPPVFKFSSTGAGGTDILISWVYKLVIRKGLYSYGAAISIIIFFMIAGFSVYQFRQSDAFKEEELR
ncbi:ABC transporter permease subunit [Halanaerobacter jeridensis]|uniref:Maltose/maltodextrin transport system permease protein n=1 Tax=Halanaerobacter jeridensis TaxID=706427 RepID=A0A938XTR0_9FIRM|nr:arabinogalactan oligomer/maltooligosaccharide transport system permease protein [Halanaerobacter jeridensis]